MKREELLKMLKNLLESFQNKTNFKSFYALRIFQNKTYNYKFNSY